MMHFEYQIIPADQWRRIKGTTPKGDDCARPHFVPITDVGRTFAAVDAFGGMGRTGLCPGEILINGEWVTGYRFVVATEADTLVMLSDLNEQVENLLASA
jgi:hypothetical protein